MAIIAHLFYKLRKKRIAGAKTCNSIIENYSIEHPGDQPSINLSMTLSASEVVNTSSAAYPIDRDIL